MRTFRSTDWRSAQQAWADGEFGYQWQKYRAIAAERGFIFPPAGTRHDDRDVESPSQRAIVWRAIEDNPTELERIVRRSSSWSQVVDGIIGLEARLREDADEADRIAAWERANDDDRVGHEDSVKALGAIMQRIDDSR